MAIIWNAPVGKTVDLLEISDKRELFWYGVTVGQVGFGLLVSRLRQPTKRAMDVACTCGAKRAPAFMGIPHLKDCPAYAPRR
jgi:hypothetical protein